MLSGAGEWESVLKARSAAVFVSVCCAWLPGSSRQLSLCACVRDISIWHEIAAEQAAATASAD